MTLWIITRTWIKKYVFLYLFSGTLPYRGEMRLCVIYPIPLSMQGAYIREPPRTSVVDAAVGRVLCDAHCPTERYTEPPLPSKWPIFSPKDVHCPTERYAGLLPSKWPIFSPKDAHCLNSGIKFPIK